MPEDIDLLPMNQILSYEQIVQIAENAAKLGIRKIKITGGEPLVRVECPQLIARLKSIPGIEQVTMTTNGVLLERFLPQLLEAGLDAVNVSLDTLKPEKFEFITRRDEHAAVLRGIDAAVKANLPTKINCVLQRDSNFDEWMDMAKLTLEKKLDVRFIEMMPIGNGQKFEPIYNDDLLAELRAAYDGVQEDKTIHGNGPATYVKLPGAKGSVGFISAMHGKFCADCNRIRLTALGKLKPCLCFADTVDLMECFTGDREETDRRLLAGIRKAIDMKPQSHKFEQMKDITETKKMVEIGG